MLSFKNKPSKQAERNPLSIDQLLRVECSAESASPSSASEGVIVGENPSHFSVHIHKGIFNISGALHGTSTVPYYSSVILITVMKMVCI
jgi:hypothetical protein